MLLTDAERDFLAAYIYEATTEPFKGPATEDLHGRGIYYDDLSYLMTAFHRERSPSQENFGGRPSKSPPPSPWLDRAAALRRNREIQALLNQSAERVA
jgi:hypothetical protein